MSFSQKMPGLVLYIIILLYVFLIKVYAIPLVAVPPNSREMSLNESHLTRRYDPMWINHYTNTNIRHDWYSRRCAQTTETTVATEQRKKIQSKNVEIQATDSSSDTSSGTTSTGYSSLDDYTSYQRMT